MKKRLLLLFLTNVLALLCRSQIPYFECLNDDGNLMVNRTNNEIFDSRNGCSLSPNGTLYVLMVFAEIEYDVHPENDPNPSGNSNWPVGELPVWKDQLFDPIVSIGQGFGSVTRYYHEASFGSHHVLGDYLINPQTGSGIFKIKESDGYTYSVDDNIAETILCDKISDAMTNGIVTANGLNNISYFDNWTYTGSGMANITPSQDNPRKIDYVVFIWRNRKRNNKAMDNTGYTGFSGDLNIIGYGVDYCMNIGTFSNTPTAIIRHEYAHELLGPNSFHAGGGGSDMDYWIPQIGGWSMLGLSGSSLQCCNAWDRWRLGWRHTGCLYDIAAHDANNINYVNGDLDALNDLDQGVYCLRDFLQSGDAIRIKLPFIDSISEYPEYIWLENHTGFSHNNSDYDKWQYESFSCVESFSGGLMAYVQIDKDVRMSTEFLDVFGGSANYIRPLTANGFYDRLFEDDSITTSCVYNKYTHAFNRYLPNALTGGGDEEWYALCLHDYDNLEHSDQRHNFVEKSSDGQYHHHLYTMGHNSHIFNYPAKIGISTNPSTACLVNMVGYDEPLIGAKNVRNSYLNGISVEILEQYNNGDIKIRIRFDDIDINDNVRWCSENIILNDISTTSGYSMNLKSGKTITLDQGLTATRMTNPMIYNGRKIFTSPTTFTIQPGVNTHIESNAGVVLKNASNICFKDKSSCIIENNGFIEVKEGSSFQLDNCASLVIKGNGKLIVRDTSELRISHHAFLSLENGLQNLIIGDSVIIPEGYSSPFGMLNPNIGSMHINSNVTWSESNKIIADTLFIDNGATLTVISSVLRFLHETSCIIIDCGGKLVVDGSVLTTLCSDSDNMWLGVQVWGNSSETQYPINGAYRQGKLELKNGAVIENAICAVELWNPNHSNTSGGMVYAENTVFRNNAKAIHALYYTNYHPFYNVELPYQSYFDNCKFIVDTNYIGTETFLKHVDMDHINGITFRGCDFSADRSTTGVSPNCMGIGAYDSGFRVESNCDSNVLPCPTNSIDHCTFTGFQNGIAVFCSGINYRTITIRDAIFTNNKCGIFAQNIGYATILNNVFNIGNDVDCSYGVYAEGVSGFCIEENDFIFDNDTHCITCGVGVFNSQGINDIYLNTFRNLTCGNLAYGRNTCTSEEPSNKDIVGLTYTCNDNIHNEYDFCVLKDNGVGDIATKQGSTSMPAGNTFSGNMSHFYNEGNGLVDYYYNSTSNDETPDPLKLNRVTAIPTISGNSCESHYSNSGVRKTAEEKAALASAYNLANNTYNTLTDIYDSRIDGGSTATEMTEINNATSSDMWKLRARLLGYSPYVSNEVLTSTVDRDDVFTGSVLFEILAANPDELKRDTLINYIESKNNRLPDYMINILRDIAYGNTARTALTSQITHYAHERAMAAGDIIRSDLNDTVIDLAELRLWLGRMNDLASDRMVVSTYVHEGDFSSAMALANTFPTVYNLQGGDLLDHYDYMMLLDLYRTLYNSGRNVFELTEDEMNVVADIADNGYGTSRLMAESILIEISDRGTISYYCPNLVLEMPDRGITSYSYNPTEESDSFIVIVRPSPATTWVNVEYKLPEKHYDAVMTIVNMLGLKVKTVELSGTQGIITVDLRDLPAGIYGYTVRSGDYQKAGRMIITK